VSHLPADLPARLRKHGLTVVEVDGWLTRGRPASTGGFDPVGVLCHHTASGANGKAALPILINGRSDLPGPLCQLSLDRQGIVYVVAAGRANHAGVARPSGTVAGGDGNVLYIGIEAQNRGTGEPWPKAQYDAYVLLAAALCVEVTGNSAQSVRGHKETSTEGKIDPAGPTPYGATFDMGKFRSLVAAKITALKAPKPTFGPKLAPHHDVFHLESPRWKHEENSIRGVEEAVRHGKTWIDLDNQLDALGTMWATHWLRPGVRDNFRDPAHLLSLVGRIDKMSPTKVARLRTKDGKPRYHISESIPLVLDALEKGLNVEFEPKSALFGDAQFTALWVALTPAQRKRVWVKAVPTHLASLKPAHEVGFTTMVLSHGAAIPASAKPYLDFHRGTIRWSDHTHGGQS
jgi:hypothetical protein